VLSPLAVLIAIAVVMAQWRRMINEEGFRSWLFLNIAPMPRIHLSDLHKI
jgi:hypothetical protein